MALINYTATSYMKGFIINAIVTALISAIVIEIRISYENDGYFRWIYDNFIPPDDDPHDPTKRMILTFGSAFIVTFFIYILFHFITGFGGGFIVADKKINFF